MDLLVVAAVNYGTVPDWFAGVGTVGTLAFTLWLFTREQGDRRRAQARLVFAWPTAPEPKPGGRDVFFTFKVKNGSAEPIYGVRATMVPYDSPYAKDPEAATGQVGTVTARHGILPEGRSERQPSTRPGRGSCRERSDSPSPTPRGAAGGASRLASSGSSRSG